jgi:hypothetical protein
MARWLLGLKADELSAQKTFRMLNAFIVNQGDLLQQGKLRYVSCMCICMHVCIIHVCNEMELH